ncbi:cellulose biosynthesis protein BcsO [Pantoea sp. LMR881]|uniref:cellulose biosynthesis protein BcsO n=1 Tax=Pantoea sp. LMR881 TaxID=3014336 RepID=UPI0022AF3741|nr:cellulose biosynthesis protein BcsO [Pantoea sp. LMR881]MCZ4059661.1 cellulose biosynthesis protein BcsO [Pantoea sp. LMR881]
MKSYDDLQRFKEKTQTLDIAFKDMSGQTQEAAEQSKWALIRQLANDEQHAPFGSGQRIDLPEPQPVRADAFSAPAPTAFLRQAHAVAPSNVPARASILDSLAASTGADAPVDVPASEVSSLFPPPLAHAQSAVVSQPENPPPAPATCHSVPVAAQPPAAPVISTEPGRFGALFRSRNSEPVSLSKETLLKPLLEKIALCR